MINELKALEKMILQIRDHHQTTINELRRLQEKPNMDGLQIEKLTQDIAQLQQEKDLTQTQLLELDKRYQNLAEAHKLIGEAQEKLQDQIRSLRDENETLKKQNHNLAEKNRIAAQHTKIVLERLTQIDQLTDEE